MSVLIDKEIVNHMKDGNIIIEPYDERNLNTTSYDVTLGMWYYRESPSWGMYNNVYNIYDKSHVDKVWGSPQHATRYDKLSPSIRNQMISDKNIKDDDHIILLNPGETILAHTNERIGGQHCITSEMKARSTIGRSFIGVCKCAGWGDIGYTNFWTFEITNFSRYHIIPLVVGRRIAQIVFYKTSPCDRDYAQEGKYHDKSRQWEPSDMLPRAYQDYEIQNIS